MLVVTIEAASPAELAHKIVGLAVTMGARAGSTIEAAPAASEIAAENGAAVETSAGTTAAATDINTESKKRGRRTKAQIEADQATERAAASTSPQPAAVPSQSSPAPVAGSTSNDAAPAATAAAPAAAGPSMKDKLMAALNSVVEKKDLQTARNTLAKFKSAAGTAVSRISELQEADSQPFIDACAQAVG